MAFKVVRQHDERDCGAACLAMIARHHRAKYPLSTLRGLTKTDLRGANLYGLVDGGRQLGLISDALQGSPEELIQGVRDGRIPVPFIAHLKLERTLHYIVVVKLDGNGVLTADPAKGLQRQSLSDFRKDWTGYIVTYAVSQDFSPGNHASGGIWKYRSLLQGQYRKLSAVLALSLAISAVGILGALAFQVVIDSLGLSSQPASQTTSKGVITPLTEAIAEYTATTVLTAVFASLISLYVLQAIIQYIRGHLIIVVSKHIDIRLILSYFNHIVDLPVSSIAVRRTGEYISRVSDAAAIRSAISSTSIALVLDATMVMGGGVVLFIQSGPLFGIALALVAIYAVILLAYRKPIERTNRQGMENNAAFQAFMKEAIDGSEAIKASGAGEHAKRGAKDRFFEYIDSVVRAGLVAVSQEALTEAVQAIGTACILWLGFTFVADGLVSLGSLITFFALLGYFVQPVRNLVELQPAIQTAIVAADRLNDVMDLPIEEQPRANAVPLARVTSLVLSGVSFRYGNRELVLDDVSLSVRAGERIGIVGESGSGKSTLAKVILRFYEPEKGRVLVNGELVDGASLADLRGRITYIPQSTFLFNDSIEQNIRLGDPSISDEMVREASRAAGAEEFVLRLPLGYGTVLDENGMNISGGQRQRIAIARAMARDPDLVILDEATSNLDSATEARVKESLFDSGRERAFIIVAHRLSAVQGCDRIYVLSRGKVVEQGTHSELLRDNDGVYSGLWRRQIASQGEHADTGLSQHMNVTDQRR